MLYLFSNRLMCYFIWRSSAGELRCYAAISTSFFKGALDVKIASPPSFRLYFFFFINPCGDTQIQCFSHLN